MSAPRPNEKKTKKLQAQKSGGDARRPRFTVGEVYEYRVARLFFALGFFVRRGRDILTVNALDKATDLDVLAIRYSVPFRREIQIAECKDAVNAGPLDRIFWLNGVKQFVSADRATLVRRGTRWNIKDFAKGAGVEILDFPRLAEMEASLGIKDGDAPGLCDFDWFSRNREAFNASLAENKSFDDVFQTLSGEVRFNQPFPGFNLFMFFARQLTRSLLVPGRNQDQFRRYLYCDALAHICMFVMRIAEECYTLHSLDTARYVTKGLQYGDSDPQLYDRLMAMARRLSGELISERVGQPVIIGEETFQVPVPPEAPQVKQIVDALLSAPRMATSILPILDYVAMEVYLKKRTDLSWLSVMYPGDQLRERLEFTLSVLRTLRCIEVVPPDFVAEIEGAVGAHFSAQVVSGTKASNTHSASSLNEPKPNMKENGPPSPGSTSSPATITLFSPTDDTNV